MDDCQTFSRRISAHLERIDRTLSPAPPDDQLDRLAELGTMTALLAHEINNLMTRAQMHTQLALRHTGDESSEHPSQTLERLLGIILNATQLTESMMGHADPAPSASGGAEGCDVQHAHHRVQDMLCPTINTAEYIATWDTQGLKAGISPIELEQVLTNLYLNAEHAINERRSTDSSSSGIILVHAARACSTGNTPSIRITVQDTGKGISSSDLPTIFQPWKRSEPNSGGDQRPGHGLGLAVCQRLITGANGTISCESTPDVGTTFTIVLPAAQAGDTTHAQAA